MWQYTGAVRPPFAETCGKAEESVWDYPRPPAIVATGESIVVRSGAGVLASSTAAMRVLETASPPTYYLPPGDVDVEQLIQLAHSSYCEWKGRASYWALAADLQATPIAWSYAKPRRAFRQVTDYFAFYPGRLACFVDGERVRSQAGGFYGGWVTDRIVGPYKGEPGSEWW